VSERREISRTRCGCIGSVDDAGDMHLALCCWHSRWCKRAKIVVLAGEIHQVTIRADFTPPKLDG